MSWPVPAPAPAPRVLSVRELTRRVKDLLEGAPELQNILVRGELSNFKRHTSGHLYFTLKDEAAAIRCVMFRSRAERVAFAPRDGLRVLAGGSVNVYDRDGQYQLYVEDLQPDGLGALHLAFEQLKQRLAEEGLFESTRKRPLPRLPRKVGVVTSPAGAAIRDIVTVARRRFPNVHLVLAPVPVQGEDAPPAIVRALGALAVVEGVDVIIAGRGGGSIEELWAFNDEAVARAIAACPVPVVSAVGHETDFTIADFVADVRAATPSAAAELVVPDKEALRGHLAQGEARLRGACRSALERARARLERVRRSRALVRPAQLLAGPAQRRDHLERMLVAAMKRRLEVARARHAGAGRHLHALSPLAALERGYAVVRGAAGGRVVRSVREVAAGDRVEIVFRDGTARARVEAAREGGPEGGGAV